MLSLWCSFVATLMSSCATQRYGRMQNVSEAERSYLTCEQIEIETEKANAFIREVAATNSEFTGRDVLGFLGDFGIGNHMEFSDAVESGQRRFRAARRAQNSERLQVPSCSSSL